MKFNTGDLIPIEGNGEAEILSIIGEGGQGVVYKVSYNGNEYALKWNKSTEPSLRQYIQNNIKGGPPSKHFLWPLFLAKKDPNVKGVGYLMNLLPKEYKELKSFRFPKKTGVLFESHEPMINSALNLCVAFSKLHTRGLAYLDVSSGNIAINPKTGDILILDNDNVVPNGDNPAGIQGTPGYVAPELIKEECIPGPNRNTDLFSLSVVLFMIFFINHPLEGKQTSSVAVLTPRNRRILFGESPLFCMDELNPANRPVPGIHSNIIRRWDNRPEILINTFVKAFSQELLLNKKNRIGENEWIRTLCKLRNMLSIHCQNLQTFSSSSKIKCTNCGKNITPYGVLKFADDEITVSEGSKIYKYTIDKNIDNIFIEIGEIIRSKKNPQILGLKNKSGTDWTYIDKQTGTNSLFPTNSILALKENEIIININIDRVVFSFCQ